MRACRTAATARLWDCQTTNLVVSLVPSAPGWPRSGESRRLYLSTRHRTPDGAKTVFSSLNRPATTVHTTQLRPATNHALCLPENLSPLFDNRHRAYHLRTYRLWSRAFLEAPKGVDYPQGERAALFATHFRTRHSGWSPQPLCTPGWSRLSAGSGVIGWAGLSRYHPIYRVTVDT
jgi:hypothetical protein